MIRYFPAEDVHITIHRLIDTLGFSHVDKARLVCVRSKGTASRRVVARCHGLPKIMQQALGREAHYVIEVVSEKYDKLDEDEKTKTLIHELLHIPKSFGGGFRHHDYVCHGNVEAMFRAYRDSGQFKP